MLNDLDLSHHLPAEALRRLVSEPVMVVNLAVIKRNFHSLSAMSNAECAAIVKGDAYGHGMIESAHTLLNAGAELFFAARFEDACALRDALGNAPRIAVLDGITPNRISDALAHRIIPVVNSLEQLETVACAASQKGEPIAAFVHLDTAMNRLGLAPQDDETALPMLRRLNVQAYMTHFASADDLDLNLCRRQTEIFRARTKRMPKAPLSIANSCGVFLGAEFHEDIIRPGKSTFGINPLFDGDNPLEEPAMVLAPVVQTRELRKGEPVGYSCTWRAPDNRRIAILAIGYANGFMRSNSNIGQVAFGDQIVEVVGRVSMDLTAVDISVLPENAVQVGSLAEIVGNKINYRTFAGTVGTNEHEAMISLGRGCHRVHIGECNGA